MGFYPVPRMDAANQTERTDGGLLDETRMAEWINLHEYWPSSAALAQR